MARHEIILFFLIKLLTTSTGLIGYDCGSRLTNLTTLSLLDVGECDIATPTVNSTQIYIQLLQIDEYKETRVYSCKIRIHRIVAKCGMFSHISLVNNGESDYIQEIGQTACDDAHRTGTLKITDSHVIHSLRINNTRSYPVTFAGKIEGDGTCHSTTYSDAYGTWEDVIVQGTATISLHEYTARVNLNKNEIHLRSGTICALSDKNCMDMEGGYTFWSSIPIDNCKFNQYSVIYEGFADKIIDESFNELQTVYTLTTNDITFALTAKEKLNVCGYMLIKTEHPKLLILETFRGNTFAEQKEIAVSNLDIFLYVNSKFVYVEKHIRSQIKELYRNVLMQQCNLERRTIQNTLTIATQSPDEFAFNLMKKPGYMAVTAGEVVHVVKCIPVEIKVQHGTKCYLELEVTWKNATHFLTPRTHILKTKGTEIPCNSFLPNYFHIEESWYRITPNIIETLPPETLKPTTKDTWKYKNPSNLATSGIYSSKDLEQLRERIMFPVEKPAMLNDLAREMDGYVTTGDSAVMKLINKDALSNMIESTLENVWNKFLLFGTASAGFMAIITIIHGLKLIVNTIIRGYALHDVFGWSFYILGALWGALTQLFIYRHHATSVRRDPEAAMSEPDPAMVQAVLATSLTVEKEVAKPTFLN